VRSAFVGLSGWNGEFNTIDELCNTARRGIYLDPKMVPVFDIPADETDEPLNAYILDFFKHGQVWVPIFSGFVLNHLHQEIAILDDNEIIWPIQYYHEVSGSDLLFLPTWRTWQLVALERYNGMQRDTIFEELKSFSLLLRALHAAMDRRKTRSAEGAGPALFSDEAVLHTFRNLSEQFMEKLRETGSTGLFKEAGISRWL
jgi:hypothetical protein